MNKRKIQRFKADWRGIALRITFERNWLSSDKPITAHLEIHTDPERQPLPVTETGYRSHFVPPELVDEAGGPVAYVLAWLEHESRSQTWKAAEFVRRQCAFDF